MSSVYPRPHSPSSLEAASELLHLNMNSSQEKMPQLAAASLMALPPSFASSQIAPEENMTPASALATAAAAAVALRPVMATRAAPCIASIPGVYSTFGLPTTIGAAATAGVTQKREPQAHDVFAPESVDRRQGINRPIDHDYTDFAPISDDEVRMLDVDRTILKSPGLSPEKKRLLKILKDMPTKTGGLAHAFPSKLHAVVSNPEFSNAISWMPHGRAFVIKDPDALVKDVLPHYFNQTKFLSFIRQLNLWGFKRLTRGVQGKAYYHELFLIGRPYLTFRIKRHKVKGHGQPIPNPYGEPNFYNFSQLDGSTSAEENKFKEVETQDKKHDVSSRTSAVTLPSQLSGLETANIYSHNSDKKSTVATDKSDCNFLTSSISHRSVPSDVAAMPTVDIEKARSGDSKHDAALLRYQAALSARGALADNHTQSDAVARARLAAMTGLGASQISGEAHFSSHPSSSANSHAALMHLNAGIRNEYPSALTQYAAASQPNMDDFLTRRLAELQREQNEIEMLRRARMMADLSASHFNLFGGSLPSVPRTSQAMSVAEAIREANHLEEMATASRNRARILALADAIGFQSEYEGKPDPPKDE